LSGPITIPFPPPPPQPKRLSLPEIAAIDEGYSQIVDALKAAKIMRNRAKEDEAHQRIIDMLNEKALQRGGPVYVVRIVLPGSLDHD